MTQQTTTDDNRQRFPWVAEQLDRLRKTFGEGVSVAACREGDDQVGEFYDDRQWLIDSSKMLQDMRLQGRTPGAVAGEQ